MHQFPRRHVIHHIEAECITCGDSAEALLACSVPDLELHGLSFSRLHDSCTKIDADGGHECLGEGVISEAHQQAALANA
jgi:hypothetical protein